MDNNLFFATAARAQGKPVSSLDINPITGRLRTPFDGNDDEARQRNQRILRSPNGGMTGGPNPQRKILGVDKQQADEQRYKEEHKNDAFFKMARAQRQKDPHAGHETDEQFDANNAAETPVPQGGIPVKPKPAVVKPAAPVAGVPKDIQNNPVLALSPVAPAPKPAPIAAPVAGVPADIQANPILALNTKPTAAPAMRKKLGEPDASKEGEEEDSKPEEETDG